MAMTQEYLKSILDYNSLTGIFTWKVRTSNRVNIGDIAGSANKDGYIQITIYGVKHYAHRLAYLYIYGWLPPKVDHINNDGPKSDNRIANLRPAKNNQNLRNRGKTIKNTSGFKGVFFAKKPKNGEPK